jgi:heme-degrading monooxygenase HmoA
VFIAMNRFRIAHGFEETFEALWRSRDSQLAGVPGFLSFQLLRATARPDALRLALHLGVARGVRAWTRSEAFPRRMLEPPKGTYLERLQGFGCL